MPARVLFVGLDAAEPDLIQRWAAEGALPFFAGLDASAVTGSLANCMMTLPGAIWPEIMTGRSCGKAARYFHPRQLRTGEAAARRLLEAEVAGEETLWDIASASGRRVAVVDFPHSVRAASLNGAQIVEYGLHDRVFGTTSTPAGLLPELERRHGPYPAIRCDYYGKSVHATRTLADHLRLGIERKTAMLLDLLGREPWDLFACVFSESHCGGHQLWHFADPSHPDHDPAAPPDVKDALRGIYRGLDVAVRRLVEAAGRDTTVLVLASHGMGPYIGGYQLLPEVLARLGMSSGGGTATGRRVRRFQDRVKRSVPRRYWDSLSKWIVDNQRLRGLIRPVQRRAGAMFFPLESPRTRAVYLPNNTIGAIRLNVKGREPHGAVSPGAETAALVDELRAALHALRDPRSGKPIVDEVRWAREEFGPDHHPDVPDLMVSFRRDLGMIEACESEAVGRVEVPLGSAWGRRSGDHTPSSRLWALGPGLPAGRRLSEGSALDIAPTVLDLLGCAIPPTIDGRPLPLNAR